ncbi:ecotropic viral integration site 5 ortholog isoform X2 [Gouania willdenowi]|uniref:ecotropic viral integration site 5 ortholog isoform X2 n=1 Tax=Gouania willdenowi TaxID=441366 RepID=UPI00105625C9|nr:ecotropic viral integration site 5 ortholog-like isoform X2 [Gouania willdenowi]
MARGPNLALWSIQFGPQDLGKMDVEQSWGSEVSLEPETDRFGFLVTNNGSMVRSDGPSPELVRHREAKWINIISHWDHMLMKRSSKVRLQCQKGIPASLRAKCWPLLCGAAEKMKQNQTLYKLLNSQPGLESWVDVIKRDLDRQFPFHEMFLSKDGHGQRGLFEVLKAYTQYQPEDGYCQAQGPVAAVLLMNMPAEEAFWCLVQISQHYLPGYYSPLLDGVLFDAAMLMWLLKKTCPSAHKHLQHYSVEPLMFATDWLMCLFARQLPFNTLLRVWDLFFFHGVQVLLQVAVVLVRRVLGRPEQRKECQGQIETLERLKGIRDLIREEEDTFITEVCSVPLSAKDLEKQTYKEHENWKRDKPSSNFDPRSRCHGYQLARVQQVEREQQHAERENPSTNPSASLSRSVSTLSLPPVLLNSRWRKTGNTNKSKGAKKVTRHFSMRTLADGSSDLDFEKMQRVQEERLHSWSEVEHFRQTQQRTAECALLQKQGEQRYNEKSQKLLKPIEVSRDEETTSQSEFDARHDTKDQESDAREQVVVNEADSQNEKRKTPEAAESETETPVASNIEQKTIQAAVELEMENEENSLKESSKNLDSESSTNVRGNQVNQDKVIIEGEREACGIEYHNAESIEELEKTEESHDQTGALAQSEERTEENAATQDEPTTETTSQSEFDARHDTKDQESDAREQVVVNEADSQNEKRKTPEAAESETETPMASNIEQKTIQAAVELEMENEENSLKESSKNLDSESSTNVRGNQVNQDKVIIEGEREACGIEYHNAESLEELEKTEESHDQTGALAQSEERTEENAATQDEPTTDSEKKAEEETLTSSPERNTQQKEVQDGSKSSIKEKEMISTVNSDEVSETQAVENVGENSRDQSSFASADITSNPPLEKPSQVKDQFQSTKVLHVCRSSSFLGSTLARQLSQDHFTSTHTTGQSQATSNNHTNPQTPNHTLPEEASKEKLQSTRSKRFGHFLRGLREKQPKKQRAPKIKVPIILIQDYSDVITSQVDEEEEEVKLREQRKWQKEQKVREEEEERWKKKKEKELKKQKRGKKKDSSLVVHFAQSDSQTLRYSASHSQSYF